MKLKNKLAVVTGASTGIGRANSVEFAIEGAKVFLLARAQERLQETKELVEKVGGKAEIFVSDLSNIDSTNKTVSEIKDKVNLSPLLERFSKGVIDVRSVIKLKKGNISSFWLRLKSESGTIEGKFHFSKKQVEKLIIFEPGFPGDGSTRLEKLWLKELLKKGFDLFAIRHNGTIINGKFSDNYLNCRERQLKAKEQGQEILGDNPPYTIDDWLNEPFIALESLSNYYKEIYLVGHSFGGLAILYSLVSFHEKYPNRTNKVKRLISLAGTTGIIRRDDDPILNRWREHIDTDAARARIKIGKAEQNIKFLKKAYEKVHSKINISSRDTQMIFVYVYGNSKNTLDEFIYPNEPLDILNSLNGIGVLVIDRSEKSNESTGQLAHDMDNLKSSVFLKLLQEKLENQILVV